MRVVAVCVVAACSYQPQRVAADDATVDPDASSTVADTRVDGGDRCLQPAAHWRFDEGSGSTAADSSGNGNTLTLLGTATWDVGHTGNALALPGGSWAQVAYNATFAVTTQVSVTAWIRPAEIRTGALVVKSQRAPAQFQDWGFYQELEEVMFICNFPSPDDRGVTTGFAIAQTEWIHVGFVLDTDLGTTAFYKNGVFHSSRTIPNALLQHDEPITIGTDGGNTANDYVGLIDEVEVWTRALSAGEVGTLHAGDCLL